MARIRLDQLVVQNGIAPSRERARALILAGRILANEQKVDKPGTAVEETTPLRMLGEEMRYVSRGGLKLEAALAHWKIPVDQRWCLDIGTSTGGFTDCLLQHGAAHVSTVDTGFGQVAMKLRQDERVRLYERTNARLLTPGQLKARAGEEELTLMVMDVSFISSTLLLGPVLAAAEGVRKAVLLVKPQFEAGREYVKKGGIVRDEAGHRIAIARVRGAVEELGGEGIEVIDSPITGAEGNREFLLHAMWPGR